MKPLNQHSSITGKNIFDSLTPYLLSTPGIILLVIFVVFPFFLNIGISFTNYSLINPKGSFVGTKNYYDVLSQGILISGLIKSVIWTIGNIIPAFIIGLVACLIMNTKIKGVNILRTVVLLPWVIPEVVTGYTWQWILSGDYGILTNFIIKIGLVGQNFSFFEKSGPAMGAVIAANVWRVYPFIAVMLFAKLRTLPAEIVEAARIDGANAAQTFFYITVNWLMPIIQRVLILATIWTFNAFTIIFTMTNGGPAGATETLPILLQRLAFRYFNFGQATALGVIVLIITVIFYWLFTRKKVEEA